MSDTVSINVPVEILKSFQDLIAAYVTNIQEAKSTEKETLNSEELISFNQLVLTELTPHLGKKIAKKVVDLLDYCSRGRADFSAFRSAYRWIGSEEIEKRQLLKTIRAIYAFKFTDRTDKKSYYYSLKSEIKYATICPHCGAIANKLVDRLKSENLWK